MFMLPSAACHIRLKDFLELPGDRHRTVIGVFEATSDTSLGTSDFYGVTIPKIW